MSATVVLLNRCLPTSMAFSNHCTFERAAANTSSGCLACHAHVAISVEPAASRVRNWPLPTMLPPCCLGTWTSDDLNPSGRSWETRQTPTLRRSTTRSSNRNGLSQNGFPSSLLDADVQATPPCDAFQDVSTQISDQQVSSLSFGTADVSPRYPHLIHGTF